MRSDIQIGRVIIVGAVVGWVALQSTPAVAQPALAAVPESSAPASAQCLIAAYPKALCGFEDNQIVWCDGTKMIWDDGRTKSFEQTLSNPDIEDMMAQRYPLGALVTPTLNHDPGRVRYEPFFKKMYGASPVKVSEQLERFRWLGGKFVRATRRNRVAAKLKAIAAELGKLGPAPQKIASVTAGGFNWRKIRKTDRQSAHSFGIAIDIGGEQADFWRWRGKDKQGVLRYRNRIPLEIVEVFERNGFIWGGRWYHFDTMHFEYRPELLCRASEAGSDPDSDLESRP